MSLFISVGACNLKECYESGLLKWGNGRWALSKLLLAGLCDIWAQGFSHVGGLWCFYFKPFMSDTALTSRSRSFQWLNTAACSLKSPLVITGSSCTSRSVWGWRGEGVVHAWESTQPYNRLHRCLTRPQMSGALKVMANTIELSWAMTGMTGLGVGWG